MAAQEHARAWAVKQYAAKTPVLVIQRHLHIYFATLRAWVAEAGIPLHGKGHGWRFTPGERRATTAYILAPGPGACCSDDTLRGKYAAIVRIHAELGLAPPELP